MVQSTFLCVAAIAIACVFASCSSSTTPNGPLVQMFAAPHAGSVYSYSEWESDSAGNHLANDGSWSLTVRASGFGFAGKSNVAVMDYDSPDSLVVSYEPNGDISMYDAVSRSWQEFPVATQATRTYTTTDTSFTGEITRHETTYTYAGEQGLVLAGQTFNTVKIVEHDRYWTDGIEQSARPPWTFWFAPETGWYVKFFAAPDPSDTLSRGSYVGELTQCTLK
jgi:hypothetical protein